MKQDIHNIHNIRAAAALCLYQVVDQGRSLADVLPQAQRGFDNPKDKALLQQLCYGVLRWLPKLEFYCSQLLQKPLKGKQRVFQFLLYVGILQLSAMRIPPHAAISETVEAAQVLRAAGLKGLINGVLRNFQRRQAALDEQAAAIDSCRFSHPGWFIKRLKQAYPLQWQDILQANQQQPPMWLRVNRQQGSVEDYLARLTEADIGAQRVAALEQGILLDQPVDVAKLPGFAQGSCSVQDGAAQFAAQLLDVQAGEHVLDACAAPGGKTCHMLERQPQLATMLALDSDAGRLQRVTENLTRLQLTAQIISADAADSGSWWDGQLFDRILLDAPCSATGVIRRHPDIKWLRRQQDIESLAVLQLRILGQLWPLLKPGGTLLYATCSVLPEENRQQIRQFLALADDARLNPLNDTDTRDNPGWQLLPGGANMDGFYYARLVKQAPGQEQAPQQEKSTGNAI